VRDPTGAGDTFAGVLMGYLARRGRVTSATLRRGMAYGTVLASFNVEDFGVRRVASLTLPKVEARLGEFRKMLKF
jgi:sugar/nucleoside kinase (ribokinase family)